MIACIALAAPAAASAHARTPTVALDYRLVLDAPGRALPGVQASILDGDRDIRLTSRRESVTVLGDLGEPMLRIGPGGAFANAASPSAAAARVVGHGSGWQRVGGSTFAWHDHRLAPPPYGAEVSTRFAIPLVVGGRRAAISGRFERVSRPAVWPWLAAAAIAAAALVALVAVRPARRPMLALALGALAVAAELTELVTFNAADAPNGRVAWVQIALGSGLAAAGAAGLARLQGESRTVLAGVLGVAAAVSSIGSLEVFRHGVVISLLSPTLARLVAAAAVTTGLAAGSTLFLRERRVR